MNTKQAIRSYIIGLILSLILTLTAYFTVISRVLNTEIVTPIIIILAILQLVVQLVFFLHLTHEKKPRWNLIFFISTISIVLIVVVASIWIMDNLNYNKMPKDINMYIMEKEMIHK